MKTTNPGQEAKRLADAYDRNAYKECLKVLEPFIFEAVLERTNGNLTKSAKY